MEIDLFMEVLIWTWFVWGLLASSCCYTDQEISFEHTMDTDDTKWTNEHLFRECNSILFNRHSTGKVTEMGVSNLCGPLDVGHIK